ncbi:MAG: DUF805 domain-containing protein [Asticcacaulis sp.]
MLFIRPLIRYADFQGRASRAEYWQFTFLQLAVYVLLTLLVFGAFTSGDPMKVAASFTIGLLAFCAVSLGCFLPNLAVTVRRLHDSGKSGWWLLLKLPEFLASLFVMQANNSVAQSLTGMRGPAVHSPDVLQSLDVPFVILSLTSIFCNLVMFVFMVWSGDAGGNRFGPNPKNSGPDVSVFDDERTDQRIEEAIARAKAEAEATEKPHKPVFDFGPGATGPMINSYGRDAAPLSAPAPTGAWGKPQPSTTSPPRKSFGRR